MERRKKEMRVGLVLGIIFCCIVAQGQEQCMTELGFCISYLNNTSQPPNTCCQPLDYIVKSLPQCFCNLLTLFGVDRVDLTAVDVSKAQTLPERCGQHIDPMECITGTKDARSNNPTSNSANSKSWDSSFVLTMATSSIILSFQAL